MLINKLNGECYKDRKEAKQRLGHYTYNEMVKSQKITFHRDIDIYKESDVVL